jgi:hypothetical protein
MNNGICIEQIVVNREKMPYTQFVQLTHGICRGTCRTEYVAAILQGTCEPNAKCCGFQRHFFQHTILHRGENKY